MKPYNLLLLITLLLSVGNISAQNNNCCSQKAFLGINYQSIPKDVAAKFGIDNTYGHYVTSVIEGTAADKFGILPLDYIYGLDEYRVGRDQRLGSILRKYKPGDEVVVHFYRNGRKSSIRLVLGSTNDRYKYGSKKKSKAFFGISPYGKSGRTIGVKVSVVSNSTADEMGLQKGDVITKINGYDIFTWTEISGAISALNPGDEIAVEYIRDGRTYSGRLPIKSYKETKGESCDDNGYSYYFNWDEDGDLNINVDLDGEQGTFSDDEDEVFPEGEQIDMNRVEVSIQDNPKNIPTGIRVHGQPTLNVRNIRLSAQDNGRFNLQFVATRSESIQVRIYNEAGRQLYLYDISDFEGLFEDEVNLSQNGTGNYYLYVQSGNSYALKLLELK